MPSFKEFIAKLNRSDKLKLIAYLSQYVLPQRIKKFKEILNNRTASLAIALDNIYHQHNISAVLRSADAFAVHNIYLIGSAIKPAKGVSLGAEKWLDLHFLTSPKDALLCFKNKNYKIITAAPKEHFAGKIKNALALKDFAPKKQEKYIITLGNEKTGVSPLIFNNSDYYIYIPMYGFVESLNVSVTAAIFMKSLIHKLKSNNIASALDNDYKETILTYWLTREIKQGEQLVKNFLNKS